MSRNEKIGIIAGDLVLRSYVVSVQRIHRGMYDPDLPAKTRSLSLLFPKGYTQEWADFTSAADQQNRVNSGELRLDKLRELEATMFRREHILNTMFSKYLLLGGFDDNSC